MTKERGAVFQAAGRRYIDQAGTAARSIRETNPGLGTAIFCDDAAYARSHFAADFDEIIDFKSDRWISNYIENLRSRNQLFGVKVPVACRLPFETSLLIDSDTITIGDLTPAFDLMQGYDILACEDADHLIDTDTRSWKAIGLTELHQHGYFNSGVIYFRHSSRVQAFVDAWADVYRYSSSEYALSCDQNALNFVLCRPAEYMSDISFSSSALRSERYNAACRFWMEVWEAGLWKEVRLLHTWMSDGLHRRLRAKDFDWESFFYTEKSEAAEYVRRFSIGRNLIDRDVKRRCYKHIADRPISLRHYINNLIESGGSLENFESLSKIYVVDQMEALCISNARSFIDIPSQNLRVLQIGLRHCYAELPDAVFDTRWRTGFDLEFLSAVFETDKVLGFTPYPFLRYDSSRVKTVYQDYRNSEILIENGIVFDVILDIDGSVSDQRRLQNAAKVAAHLSPRGVFIFVSLRHTILDDLILYMCGIGFIRLDPMVGPHDATHCIFVAGR